ncbi:unnamed protein product [Arabis nemorensis]|uniref:Rab3 GTPase-activating protein catalytic subunit n=1 Tax=Arabis nemorensis TaxID=586526 RepID=A0A565CS82_9BRAS|nr:unnamed protein product [Arabis nemorensis]
MRVFEDFIRWDSPGDWESFEHEATEPSEGSKPRRGHLSQRMSDQGNLWRKSWNDASTLPADDQKPLLDSNRDGEKCGLTSFLTKWSAQPSEDQPILLTRQTSGTRNK